ncbi:MAG: preprotein translocase subunit YajC [Actinobacteria bacterium]|nr:preprotein translocase subunit YajC [Actinomycetota bacterium]
MHPLIGRPLLLAVASAASKTTTTTKSSSGGGSEFLLVIIVLFALLYFLLIRPNQRRRMQAVRQSRTFGVGDEVVAGGMMGRVARLGDEEVDVEVSDGVVISFVPQAVQLRSAYQANQQRRSGGLFGGGAGAYGGSAATGRNGAGAGAGMPSSGPSSGSVFANSGAESEGDDGFTPAEPTPDDEGAEASWSSAGTEATVPGEGAQPQGAPEATGEVWPGTAESEAPARRAATSGRRRSGGGSASGGAGRGA